MSDFSDSTSVTARVFDGLAATYDSVGVDFFQPIAASLSNELQPSVGEQWLDIGCGRGAVLQAAGAALGPAGHITGIDVSPKMVSLASEMIQNQRLSNASVHLDDAQQLSRTTGRFDAISSCLVLFFLPRPDLALRSWRSLLVSGGRLGVTTFGPIDDGWMHVDEVFEPFLPQDMLDARTAGKRGPFASDQSMEQLVADSGYEDVHTVTATIPVTFRSPQQWYDFTWSIGQRQMWMAIPQDAREAVRAEAEARLKRYATSDNSITFTQTVRHTLASNK